MVAPQTNYFKLNIDGAYKKCSIKSGMEGLIRDSTKKWVVGFMSSSEACCVLHSELLALHRGLEVALPHNYVLLQIELDSIDIFYALDVSPPFYNSVVCSCTLLLKKLGNPVLNHTFREANGVADILGKLGIQMTSNHCQLLLSPPNPSMHHLEADLLVSKLFCNKLAILGNFSVFSIARNTLIFGLSSMF